MRALVLEGGAMRGIFTAGVLDALTARREPPFDLIVGVSAGACCAASFLARQPYRNYVIFHEYLTTRSFSDPTRFFTGGSMVDMKWLMNPVTKSLYPLDVETMRASPTRFETVATQAHTGEPAYLPAQGEDCLDAIHATVAIPFFYRGGPVRFRGQDYFDGAVSDPIPLDYVMAQGATHVTVVLTRSRSWSSKPLGTVARALLARNLPEYPVIVRALTRYDETQRQHRAFLDRPPRDIDLRVFLPPDDFPVERFTRDRASLHYGYLMGKEAVARQDR